MPQLPELLAPAGDIEKAYVAFQYGADAIFCGCPLFSLRTRANIFSENNIAEIVEYASKNNKKVYVVVNGFPHEELLPALKKHLEFLAKIKPHGLIIADAGVLALANEIAPEIDKHLSVQATSVNTPAMKFWWQNKVRRIILAREISAEEIKKMHEAFPEMELECFVHGSMCMSYSGRCLISSFLTNRDANKGECAHCCRWNYRIYDENGYEVTSRPYQSQNLPKDLASQKNIHDLEKKQYWEEELRPNEFMTAEEDFHGTHIMSSRDLCQIEYLPELIQSGIRSIKIEGRNKTVYYLATVVRAYRKALDDYAKNNYFEEDLWAELHAVANRGFFTGFFHGKPGPESQQYAANVTKSTKVFAGVVREWKNGFLRFDIRNRIDAGDKLEFIFPEKKNDFSIVAENLHKNEKNNVMSEKTVESLHGGDGEGWIKCEKSVPTGVIIRKPVNEERTENFSVKTNFNS